MLKNICVKTVPKRRFFPSEWAGLPTIDKFFLMNSQATRDTSIRSIATTKRRRFERRLSVLDEEIANVCDVEFHRPVDPSPQ